MMDNPGFRFSQTTITFQYVDRNFGTAVQHPSRITDFSQEGSTKGINPFASFEKDLLNYQHQKEQPLESIFVAMKRDVSLNLPERYIYHSEGQTNEKAASRIVVKVCVSTGYTTLKTSGVRIWHLTIKPAEDQYFTENEMILLTSSFGSTQESLTLSSEISFSLKNNPEPFNAAELLRELSGERGLDLVQLHTGIIQIVEAAAVNLPVNLLKELFSMFLDDKRTPLIENDLKRYLKVLCGILLGIFDYERMDNEEIYDTIQTIMGNDYSFMVLCRGALLKISRQQDEIMSAVSDNILVSPYLLIPNTLLAHNEFLLSKARRKLNDVLKSISDTSLKILEQTQTEINEILNHHLLREIFHYKSEQTIIDTGNLQRGISNVQTLIGNRMDELSKWIDIKRENKKNLSDALLNAFLAFIALVPLNSIFKDYIPFVNGEFILYLTDILIGIIVFSLVRVNKR